MSGDDLNDPLGLPADGNRRGPAFRMMTGAAALIAFSGLAIFLLVHARSTGDPWSDEPHALASIERAPAGAPPTGQTEIVKDTKSVAPAVPPADRGDESREKIEFQNGVKIVRPNGTHPPGALFITVPQSVKIGLAPAPDRRIVEKSRYGLLPRIGADGARPAEIYARPLDLPPSLRADAPRIAFVIGGMGLSTTITDTAIDDLPAAVTLAFAPYGNEVERQVARARSYGHEIVLQLPMEPFDSQHGIPGPHMLLSAATALENSEHLHWLMSRFSGYAGVMNFLGGKLTADETGFAPILQELADRGLYYADDGSSSRSAALALARRIALPAGRADIIVDTSNRQEAMESALLRLEALAREKGSAIGMASGLPTSLERVSGFVHALEKRGIALVPLSALMRKDTDALVKSEN